MIIRLLCTLHSHDGFEELVFGSKMEDELALVKIDRHIRENLKTVDTKSLCADMHFNSTYYNRIIKKRTGLALTEYIQKKRIDKAKSLLLESNKPIGDVMDEVVYKNKNFFYKLFVGETGMTPKQFRAEHDMLFGRNES